MRLMVHGSHQTPLPDARSIHRLLFLLSLAYIGLSLHGLGSMQLWSDEGNVAVGSQRVLHHGVPVAWDGKNLYSFEGGHDLNHRGYEIRLPWLHDYLGAAGMALFGENRFGVRFFFTILATLNIPLTYLFSRRMGWGRTISFSTALGLAVLPAHLLYIRQAYHYGLDITFTLLALIFFLEIDKKARPFLIALCLALNFHLNYMTPLWVGLSLVIWTLWERKALPLLRRPSFWGACLFIAVSCGGWIYATRQMEFNESLGGWQTFLPHYFRLANVLGELNISFPIIIFIPFLLWCGIKQISSSPFRRLFRCLISMGIPFLILGAHQYGWLRYYLAIIVPIVLLSVVFLKEHWKWSPLRTLFIACILYGTTLLQQASQQVIGRVWKDFARFRLHRISDETQALGKTQKLVDLLSPMLVEIPFEWTHPAVTPLDEVIDYLNLHAQPGDQIVTLYEAEVLQFNTRLITAYQVDPREQLQPWIRELPSYVYSYRDADWLLLRHQWKRGFGMMELGDLDQNAEITTQLTAAGAILRPIPLTIRERFPNQLPNLFGRTWTTIEDTPTMMLYRVIHPDKTSPSS